MSTEKRNEFLAGKHNK